jgi:hypothetical protein
MASDFNFGANATAPRPPKAFARKGNAKGLVNRSAAKAAKGRVRQTDTASARKR